MGKVELNAAEVYLSPFIKDYIISPTLMTRSRTLEIYSPVRIVFGANTVRNIGEIASQYGKKVLVVTMNNLIEIGLQDELIRSLKKNRVNYSIYSEVHPEPTCDEIDRASKVLRKGKFDVVIGFGGGSCMDFTKALAILAKHPKGVWSYVDLSNKPPEEIDSKRVLPVITIPTTSGTGSEVTPFAVANNTKTMQKGTIKNPAIYPKVTIIDPELTLSVPKNLTASIGIDALSHMLENYYNVARRSPYSDALVENSLKMIIQYLPLACSDGENLQARTGVAWASALAGVANANAGTTVVHALSHPTGARLHVPHGLSVAIFLISVMKKTISLERDRLISLSRIFGIPDKNLTSKKLAANIINYLEEFQNLINTRPRLSEYTQNNEIIKIIVNDALSYMSRPIKQHIKVFSKIELTEIVKDSY